MNKVRNVLLATAFLTMAGVAGCKKVPPVIKETPKETVDTTLTTEQFLDSVANINKASVETEGKLNKQIIKQVNNLQKIK